MDMARIVVARTVVARIVVAREIDPKTGPLGDMGPWLIPQRFVLLQFELPRFVVEKARPATADSNGLFYYNSSYHGS